MLEIPGDGEKNVGNKINDKKCEGSGIKINGLETVNDKQDRDDDDDELTLEELAPDGGWGWMVAVAMIIVFVTTFSSSSCFPIVFGEFFEATSQAGSAMTMLNSVFMVSFSLSGLMTSVLLKKYSMRKVGVVGALLYSSTNIATALATHVSQLAFLFFIQGTGAGLINTICNANFNAYFVKRRATVMSVAQSLVAVGAIIYPMMVGGMMELYGFRGTAALIGAMSLNSIFGMLLMHPVEWHLRNPDEVREERRKLMEKTLSYDKSPVSYDSDSTHVRDRRYTVHDIRLKPEPNRSSSLGNLKESSGHHSPLLIETFKRGIESNIDSESRIRPRSKSGSTRQKLPLQHRFSNPSASSIGNIAGALAEVQQRIEHLPKTMSEFQNTKVKRIHDENKDLITVKNCESEIEAEYSTLKKLEALFELSILKDRTFMLMSVGMSCVFVSDWTFSSLLPLAILESGYNTADAAMTMTVGATAELVSRILLALFTLFFDVRPKIIFFFATIAMAIAKLGYFYLDTTLTGIIISMVMIGAVRSWLYVPQPLVVVENYPVEQYAACYGIFSLISGIIIIVGGPLLGIMKDLTNSFSVCQLLLIATNCFLIIPWGMELITDYRKKNEGSDRQSSTVKRKPINRVTYS